MGLPLGTGVSLMVRMYWGTLADFASGPMGSMPILSNGMQMMESRMKGADAGFLGAVRWLWKHVFSVQLVWVLSLPMVVHDQVSD